MDMTIRGVAEATARTRIRWGILAMLFVVTTVNYADRATMSIAGPDARTELGLSAVQMGYIFSAFAWSYVVAQLPMGALLDRYGARRIYMIGLLLWSIFTMLQGTVGLVSGGIAVAYLFFLRLCMGAAEAPCFPANARFTSAWFPKQERGFASAVFNSSQYFATAAFTPIMAWIVHEFGWEHVFIIIGAVGVVLAMVWRFVMYVPRKHPRVNQAELDYLAEGGALIDLDAGANTAKSTPQVDMMACIRELLSRRMLVGIYVYQFCINVMTYFFLTWFPAYLVSARGMTILKAGFVTSLPAICGFAGGILGGWISDRMLKSGYSLTVARKTPIVIGMILAMSMMACQYVDSNALVVFFMSLAFFGKGAGALGWAVVSDTAPKEAGGITGGLFNMFGNLAGIVTPIVIGYLVAQSGSFNSALIFVGMSAAVALVMMLFVVGKIERVQLKSSLVKPAA